MTASEPGHEPETRAGSLDQALTNGREMLGQHPELALRQAQVILSRDRGEPRALRLAAAAHRALGQHEAAADAEMAAIGRSGRVPALAAAAECLENGTFGEASRLAAEHLAREPDDLGALTLSAEAAIALGLPDKAEPLLREVLGRAPDFAHAQHALGNALILMDRLQEARRVLTDLLARTPRDGALLALLASTARDLGDFEAALMHGKQLIALNEKVPEPWTGYGDTLRFAGRREEALAAYRRALAADTRHARAWWSLADMDAAALDESDAQAIERAIGTGPDDPEHDANLHFALGLVHHARGAADQAFAHLATGNALRRRAQPYDPGRFSEQVDRQLAHLRAATIPARRPREGDAPVPVFLVGMPRSGSTLLERILGRHSCIEALGELPIVPHMIERLKRDDPEALEARLARLSEDELARMGAWYLARAGERRKSARRFFIDKLHMNWRHLGLILRMLPQAIVIDLRREATDCCWSNYRTLFARGHPAANDLADIALFYRDYARFTDAMRAQAPDRILLVSYEDLVDDLEQAVRPLFEAMDLAFEPDVLHFHLSRDPVATASSEQVRRPLNRAGLARWRRYEPWLGPLRLALGDLVDTSSGS